MITIFYYFQFREDGYVVLENFATEDEVDAMRAECHQLVAGMNPADHNTAFSTTHLVSASNEPTP